MMAQILPASTSGRYVTALNDEVIATPEVEDETDATIEELVDESTEAADEPNSIEDLQAQLTALLAQCV